MVVNVTQKNQIGAIVFFIGAVAFAGADPIPKQLMRL